MGTILRYDRQARFEIFLGECGTTAIRFCVRQIVTLDVGGRSNRHFGGILHGSRGLQGKTDVLYRANAAEL